MTELDFDELDKAVNSLMSNADTTTSPDTTNGTGGASVPAVDSGSIASAPMAASAAAVQATPTPAPSVAPSSPQLTATPVAQAPSLAVKRRGQFMDMVHPSSDMKLTNRPTNRQGVTLQPVSSPAAIEEARDTAAVEPISSQEAEVVPATNPEQPQTVAATETEQPFDTPSDETKNDENPLDQSVPASTIPDEIVAEVSTPAEPEPLTTPFLADTKVEKRPLGGNAIMTDEIPAAAEDHADGADITMTSADVTPDTEQETPKPTDVASSMASDIAALEAKPLDASDVTTPTEPTAPLANEVPAGGSIAPQYKEMPSTGTQENGSIFDTANYHQAVEADQKPAKKSSFLKWLIWVIILLLIGVGAGAAYFYFTR